MLKETNENMIEFYKCNRQEITSIFASSITLLVIAIVSGIFSYFLLNNNQHESDEYLALAVMVFLSGVMLCLLYKQIIILGWTNFQIEKELKIQKFGSEHAHFIEKSKFGILEKWLYNLICFHCFKSYDKTFYHINLKFIVVIVLLSSLLSSFMFYKYLAKSLPDFTYKEFTNVLVSSIIYIVLLIIFFSFLRKEFKTSCKNE